MLRDQEPYLSLVIPAYNEEKIIDNTLSQVLQFLTKKKFVWEIIVSDDGSRDKTAIIAKKFKKLGVRLVGLPVNQGKGGALKAGMLSAKGKYVVFMDADLSVPIEFLDKLLESLKIYDVVVGSRRLEKSKIDVHQPFIRESLGRVYTNLTKLILLMNLSDFTCGFKGFSREAARKIFSNSLIKRWAYDSEIMYLAKYFNFNIKEIPVRWTNREDTRVVLRGVITESFLDLLKIRYYSWRGFYK